MLKHTQNPSIDTPHDTQTLDLLAELDPLPIAQADTDTTTGQPLQAKRTRKAKATTKPESSTAAIQYQPAELWAEYAPASDDHPVIQRMGLEPSAARVVNEEADLQGVALHGFLVVQLHNAKGKTTGLAFLPTTQGQRPIYYPNYYPTGGLVLHPAKRGGVVYMVADPQDGALIAAANLPCVVAFTPDEWSNPDLPQPFKPLDIREPKHGGNLAHIAQQWSNAGYQVAMPVLCGKAKHLTELMTGTGGTVLPLDMPLVYMQPDEIADKLPTLWQQHAPRFVASFEHGGGRFEVREDGVFFVDTDKEGHEYDRQLIDKPVYVLAKTRNKDAAAWGRLIEWRDDDDHLHRWAMPADLLQSESTDLCKELAYRGANANLSRRNKDLLAIYLQQCPTPHRALCVEVLGWQNGVYVLPHGAIGHSKEITVYQNPHGMNSALSQAGTAQQWRDHVASMASGNSRLAFALSSAFAAPLLDLIGDEGGGFHFRGASSTGKSTAQDMACSVWGHLDTFKHRWRATTNGLEGLACMHSDGLLVLDEIGQIDPRHIGDAVYMLAHGDAKERMTKNLSARPKQKWRVIFLSSGEISLSDHMNTAGRTSKAGQELRLADIPADAGKGLGIFERLQGTDKPAEFSELVVAASKKHYGTVGIDWLHHVANHRATITTAMIQQIKTFTAQHVPKGASGQIERVARRFAIVAAGGELATLAGLTGWPSGQANQAAAACFNAWLESFGGIGNHEDRAILEHVQAFIEAHGSSRFESVTADRERIANRVGYVRQRINESRQYFVFPNAFKNEISKGFDYRQVVRVLTANGILDLGENGRPDKKIRLSEVSEYARFYVICADALFSIGNIGNIGNNTDYKEKMCSQNTKIKLGTVGNSQEQNISIGFVPNCSQTQKAILGTEKSLNIISVPSVPSVPTEKQHNPNKTANGYTPNTATLPTENMEFDV